jgi:hypothetical protein
MYKRSVLVFNTLIILLVSILVVPIPQRVNDSHSSFGLVQPKQVELQFGKEPVSANNHNVNENRNNTANINNTSTTSIVHQVARKCLDVAFDELNNGDLPIASNFLERLNTILTEISQDPNAFTPYHSPTEKKSYSSALTNPHMCDWHDPETNKTY